MYDCAVALPADEKKFNARARAHFRDIQGYFALDRAHCRRRRRSGSASLNYTRRITALCSSSTPPCRGAIQVYGIATPARESEPIFVLIFCDSSARRGSVSVRLRVRPSLSGDDLRYCRALKVLGGTHVGRASPGDATGWSIPRSRGPRDSADPQVVRAWRRCRRGTKFRTYVVADSRSLPPDVLSWMMRSAAQTRLTAAR
jgi:hypothetical protein